MNSSMNAYNSIADRLHHTSRYLTNLIRKFLHKPYLFFLRVCLHSTLVRYCLLMGNFDGISFIPAKTIEESFENMKYCNVMRENFIFTLTSSLAKAISFYKTKFI